MEVQPNLCCVPGAFLKLLLLAGTLRQKSGSSWEPQATPSSPWISPALWLREQTGSTFSLASNFHLRARGDSCLTLEQLATENEKPPATPVIHSFFQTKPSALVDATTLPSENGCIVVELFNVSEEDTTSSEAQVPW